MTSNEYIRKAKYQGYKLPSQETRLKKPSSILNSKEIRAEVNEIESKHTLKKINKSKRWLFENKFKN